MCDVQAQVASNAVLSSSVTAEESETQVSVLSDTAVSLIEGTSHSQPIFLLVTPNQLVNSTAKTLHTLLDTAIISYKTSVQSFQRNTHIPEIYQHISLADLGTAYSTRYDLFSKLSDLDGAIDALTELFKLQRDWRHLTDLKSSVSILQNCGWHLLALIFLSVEQPRCTLQEIFESTQDDNTLRMLGDSDSHIGGVSLASKYPRFKAQNQDINSAIKEFESALHLLFSPLDIAKMTGNLSKAFLLLMADISNTSERFESLSQLSDIDEAIFSLRRAVDLTPKDHRDLGLRLINLGNALILRFNIDEALELQRTAIESLSEPDHQHILFISLTNYGNALMRRSEYTKDIEDAHLAVQVSRRAVEVSMSASGSSKVEVLHNAAIALLRLHDFTEQLREVDEAISYFERAISHTSLYPDAKQHILSSFGNAYMNRFETTHSLEDLNKGINLSEESLNLAKSLMKRYDLERNSDDFRRAVLEYKIVAWLPSASLPLASVSEDIDEKLAVYEIAFQQVPHIRIRATIQGVSSAAASTALTAGKKEVAVQWLEQGRAIIWNQLTMLRSPFDELIQKEFKYISGQLERTAVSDIGNLKHSSIAGDIIQEEYVQAGHRWAEKWDQLLKKSRDKDDFGKLANVDGFAIMINCCPERCDALALDLHSKKLVHISLPDFSFKKVLLLRMEMLSCLEQHGLREARKGRAIHITEKNNGSLKNILKVLWNDIIKPIIDTLHLKKVQSQYKRFGIYSGIEKVSVAEFAVSSYIPALSSLGRTFKRMAPNISCKSLDMLVITQAITPDLPPIPSAEVESVDIIKQFTTTGLHCTHLNGERATVEAVLREMSTHRFDPIKSAFYLHGGTLSLSQIIVKKYPSGVCFLSACQTEAVHLAGGMIAAGYTSVLATMWTISDEKTPLVVNIIYEELLRSTENTCAAEALHRAGVRLIDSLGCEDLALLTWVPFIHTGV
ncbi:hypothetical protein BDQ17DRAFT_1351367 [Cyathus striatus]|nr:hypothetical protein BDQ17DRAFT_1351367 [Cyathus striatus]